MGELERLSAAVDGDLPVALFPATSKTEKVSFNRISKNTGHRIKYAKVDAETGDEVANEDISSARDRWPASGLLGSATCVDMIIAYTAFTVQRLDDRELHRRSLQGAGGRGVGDAMLRRKITCS